MEQFFDLTDEHELSPSKGKPGKLRDPSKVHTIVLHQTAVRFGASSRNIAKHGRQRAIHMRFYDVACHTASLRNGDVLYVNGLREYVWHGNVANRYSVGLEVEGHYEGRVGAGLRKGKTPDVLDAQTIDGARRALRFTYEEGLRLGMPLKWIQPHRNYSPSRRNDPGEGLWREVALWGVCELGLQVDYDVARNDGRPVPTEWDEAALFDWRGRKL